MPIVGSNPKVRAVQDAAKTLEEVIKENAPDCPSRNNAIEMIGEVTHSAFYAITLEDGLILPE
jgi:hypothetical protein